MNASQAAASPSLCLNFSLVGYWPVFSDGLCYPNTGDEYKCVLLQTFMMSSFSTKMLQIRIWLCSL